MDGVSESQIRQISEVNAGVQLVLKQLRAYRTIQGLTGNDEREYWLEKAIRWSDQ